MKDIGGLAASLAIRFYVIAKGFGKAEATGWKKGDSMV
jgi:hypothetical protein